MKIFVYGTLMKDHFAHDMLVAYKAEYLGKNMIHGYAMYNLGPHPFIISAPNHGGEYIVHGELYECSKELVNKMDIYEGHPNYYHRVTVDLVMSNGEAYAYVMQDNIASSLIAQKRATFMPSGMWTHAQYKKLPAAGSPAMRL